MESWRCQVRTMLIGEPAAEVDAEEGLQVGAIVFGRSSEHGLDEEQRGHDEEEPRTGVLRGREDDFVGSAERHALLLAPMPAHHVPSAKHGQQQARAAEQGGEREHAPYNRVCRGVVVDQRFGRPVVGVGVVVAGTCGGGGPCRPTEEGGELADLFGVVDDAGPKAEFGGGFTEERGVVGAILLESLYLGVGVDEDAAGLVVAIGLEVLDGLAARDVGVAAAVGFNARERGAMEILGGKVGAKIRAMSEDGAIFHQAVSQKDALPGHDVGARKEDGAGLAFHDFGNGRLIVIGVVGEYAHNEEADDEDDGRGLNPAVGDHQRPFFVELHSLTPVG